MKWTIGVLAVIVVALAICNLPYFEEMRAFSKVEDEKSYELCEWYISKYPDGRHLDDVLYIEIQILENDMPTIYEYLTKFPNGAHASEVNSLCDKLWDAEISKYNKRDKSNESPAAVKYMSEMLQYMKTHRINTILVDVNSTLKLKDYDEYDSDVRKLLEAINDNAMSIEDGMISLKSNFTVTDNSILMEILTSGVQKSINKMFTPDFITVVTNADTESLDEQNDKSKMPHLNFEYTITSQEENWERVAMPHIWAYSDSNDKILNYLIGIAINFQAHFSIPGSSTTFDYKEKGEPSDNIKNVANIKDGYRQMTQICFAQFSNKMSENMGLSETYFQGDDDGE